MQKYWADVKELKVSYHNMVASGLGIRASGFRV